MLRVMAVVVVAVTLAGCEKPIGTYRCEVTRSCPGVEPEFSVWLAVCGSSPEDAAQNVCKGETCPCVARCTLKSTESWLC